MKNELLRSVKIAALFISYGLLVSLIVFFLFFGKGLQLLMPFILFAVFFLLFLTLEKLPFTRRHPLLKFIAGVAFVVFLIIII